MKVPYTPPPGLHCGFLLVGVGNDEVACELFFIDLPLRREGLFALCSVDSVRVAVHV